MQLEQSTVINVHTWVGFQALPEPAAGSWVRESLALLQAELDREHALRKQVQARKASYIMSISALHSAPAALQSFANMHRTSNQFTSPMPGTICMQAEADFRELVQSVDSLQLTTQPQQQHQSQPPQPQPQPQTPPELRRSGCSPPAAAADAGGAISPSVASSEDQHQQQHALVRAEAARLAADNAALRGRLAKTHRLVGAMQVGNQQCGMTRRCCHGLSWKAAFLAQQDTV